MKILYSTLINNHYTSDPGRSDYVSGETLYSEIGYSQAELVKENPAYENTCATRMSLALIKAGIPFQGRLKVKAGKYTGKTFEPGAKLLADQFALPSLLEKPEIFRGVDISAKLSGKKGVVFFWKIDNYGGGHIDLIAPINNVQVCNSACY
jgi:hypothetical protein